MLLNIFFTLYYYWNITSIIVEFYDIIYYRNNYWEVISIVNNNLSIELQNLTDNFPNMNFYFLDKVNSTNTFCKELTNTNFINPTLVISDTQTLGRGTKGRSWISPKNKGLWFSLLIKPNFSIDKLSLIPAITSVALCETFEALDINTTIKWPNDIYLTNKKLCGILTESNLYNNSIDYLIIGVGINVNLEISDLGEDLCNIATSLKIEFNRTFSRNEILNLFLENFFNIYSMLNKNNIDTILQKYKANSCVFNKKVSLINNNSYELVTPIDILNDGSLLVMDSLNTTKKVHSGEVSLRF